MRKQYVKYFLCFFVFSFAIILNSCREEIISPKNNSGNVNEPYKTSKPNSYTFILNAENISQKIVDYPDITYTSCRIFFSIMDYSSGSFEIVVLTKSREILYQNRLSTGNDGISFMVQGNKPEVIEINFNEFTGKLKFQLNGIF